MAFETLIRSYLPSLKSALKGKLSNPLSLSQNPTPSPDTQNRLLTLFKKLPELTAPAPAPSPSPSPETITQNTVHSAQEHTPLDKFLKENCKSVSRRNNYK